MGTIPETAPPFKALGEYDDRPEHEVAALQKSMLHFWDAQEQDRKQREEEMKLEQLPFGAQKQEIECLMPMTGDDDKKCEFRQSGCTNL